MRTNRQAPSSTSHSPRLPRGNRIRASNQDKGEKVKNKCVLITWATKGIVWAISQQLADEGAHVIGLARNVQDIDFPGYLYACDLSNAGQTEEVLRVIREKYPVDAIVNNAGVVKPEALGEIDLQSLYEVYDLNVRAAVQVTQAFVAAMKARQSGRIVNICSRVVHGAYDRMSYSAAKSALLGCTQIGRASCRERVSRAGGGV